MSGARYGGGRGNCLIVCSSGQSGMVRIGEWLPISRSAPRRSWRFLRINTCAPSAAGLRQPFNNTRDSREFPHLEADRRQPVAIPLVAVLAALVTACGDGTKARSALDEGRLRGVEHIRDVKSGSSYQLTRIGSMLPTNPSTPRSPG
jgi:hypothetical protein